MSFTMFVCGRRHPPERCTAPDCREPYATTCSFELRGTKEGQTCGRRVCARHETNGLCPGHARGIKQRGSPA